MKTNSYKNITAIALLLIIVTMPSGVFAGIDNYIISKRTDGGYTIAIRYSKRHWQPITTEGFFPLEKGICVVEIIGKGEKREHGDFKGTYYSSENLAGRSRIWDIGYAWIDDKDKYLYLNLFSVVPPDDTVSSNINGKYDLTHSDLSDKQLIKWLETYRDKEYK